VVALALGLSSVADAREPTAEEVDRARTFFNAGAQAYAAARYGDAVRSFEQANELAPRPSLLFSLAQAERKEFFATNDASFVRRAIVHYKTYLDQVSSGGRRAEATEAKADLEARLARLDPQQLAPSGPSTDKRRARVTVYSATAEARVSIDGGRPEELPYFGELLPGAHRVRVSAEGYFDEVRDVSGDRPIDQAIDLPLRERPALVTVVLAERADILVDGRVVATAPVARPIEVSPGPHVVSVAANGRKALSQEVVLVRGKPFRLEPKLESSGQRVVAVSMAGVGAAGVVSGLVFGALALGQESQARRIEGDLSAGNIDAAELDSHNAAIDRRDAFRTASVVSLSAGAALAVGGVLLFFLDRPTVNVVPPRGVEPAPGPPPGPHLDITACPSLVPGLWGGSLRATF
jgi:hypothetical protein